jgi:hypothetical protein
MAGAKPEMRARALALRRLGWSYRQIGAEVPVAKSTLSLWLRDVPLSEEQRVGLAARRESGARSRAAAIRAGRLRRTEILESAAAAEIGSLSDRELFLLGVAAYWCEGTKQKPWAPSERVDFINSDPGLVRLFLRWLELIGVARDDLQFTVAIHERADVGAATAYWARVAEARPEDFLRPNLKRHNPSTRRRNTGAEYVGCLVVTVRRSTDLNRRIAGWWRGIVAGVGEGVGTI